MKKIFYLKKEIKQIEEQIQEITVISSPNLNAMGGVHNNASAIENYVIKVEKLEEVLRQKNEELNEAIAECEEQLKSCEDETRIIARDYLYNGMSYQELADKYDITTRSVARKLKCLKMS